MSKPKLCQIIAVTNGKKANVQRDITDAYHRIQKADLINGFARQYQPNDEGGEALPPETKKVQAVVSDSFKSASKSWVELLDAVATQDLGNCNAKADVKVGDTVILSQVPVTNLLFLEHQLIDINTFVSKLPTLDPADDWKYDANKGCFQTDTVQTVRTKKSPKVITKAQPTKEHPAQVELIYEDIAVGKWNMVKFSGAMPSDQKAKMLANIQQLQEAVKFARETANQLEIDQQHVGKDLFDFITG